MAAKKTKEQADVTNVAETAKTIQQPVHPGVPEAIIKSAATIAKQIAARAVFLYPEAVADTQQISDMKLGDTELILVVRDDTGAKLADSLGKRHIRVPHVNLTRMGQIKTAVLIAFSQRLLDAGDIFVFLSGPVHGQLDTLVVMKVGQEWEMFLTVNQPKLTEHIKRVVFQRVLSLALELASEGREGKPAGALFVIGDHAKVAQFCQQFIINPFKGYAESERNILDESMAETVKNFCALDGAFIIKGNGVIVSAGTYLTGLRAGQQLPQGLGARHGAAAGITASTRSIAITISESTGTVRIWRMGKMITEIEKAPPVAGPPTSSIMTNE